MIQHNADDSGLLFSYQPPPPGLLDQRHLDSALFDVEELDRRRIATQSRAPFENMASTAAPGSGVIDLAVLVSGCADDDAITPTAAIQVERAAALVVELRSMPSEPELPAARSTNAPRVLVALCFAAFMVLAALLALDAFA